MSEQRPGPEFDAEREIDLHAIWRRIVHRWWLPAGGLIAGAVLGVLLSAGGGGGFSADALVYVGQTFGPGGGQVHTLETYPEIISQIINSEPVIEKAAAKAGMPPRQLEGNVTSRAINASGRAARNLSPLLEITVVAPTASKAERAAAFLANVVLGQLSSYADRKIILLKEQIAQNDKAIAVAKERLAETLAARRLVLKDKGLSLTDRILIQANANSALQFYEARLTNRLADRTSALSLLSLATEVERSRVVAPAAAVDIPTISRRNPGVIGGLIGLLAGAFAAYLVEPLLRLRKGRAQAA